ncbi:lipoprotein-releasing ABC transporter permease subunit [Paraglaciecola hydrolytica]|uniref:ABC transporter substrate-binding protein n=1 Tax=Paraglaciecola hydrolytica TaxID=1799789 RepID=A0A136A6C5_9ALTE|nr:lipoprotein-releasing ABC transporter permease subunit [Paraglaciecola hydrolytica]KXI30777.1 ABC transporter substrate-binding protein [Paraglaciecola hydrolytica]
MHYPLSAFVGLRYAKAAKGSHFIAFINFFSVVGIALGLMALITVLAVMNGFEGELKLRNLGITPHVLVHHQDEDRVGSRNFTVFPEVLAQAEQIDYEGLIQSSSALQGVMIQGVDSQAMQQHSIIAQNMLVGSLNNLVAGHYGVVIGHALARKLNLSIGEKTRLLAAKNSFFGPFGRIYNQRIFTVVGIFDMSSALDDKVVLLNIDDAAKLIRSQVDKESDTRLFLDDAFSYLSVVQQLNAQGLSTTDWRTQQGALFDAVKMEKNMMSLMLLLIIAVAAFNIVSALVMVVTEKQGDIAILLTQGMTRQQVMQIFLFNGLYNGIKGTLWGVLGGLLLVFQLNNMIELLNIPIYLGPNGQGLPIHLEWQQVVYLVGISLLLCFLASLYPAYRSVKVEPARALKYE